jgi:hypothetical protein
MRSGSRTCDLLVGDVDDSAAVQSSDVLAVLRRAVGQPLALECPACDEVEGSGR